MKTILYVGATLMIGASIYGFVDYKKTSHDKNFSNMYDETKEVKPEAINTTSEATIAEPAHVKEITKAPARKRVEQKEETYTPVSPIKEDEKIHATAIKVIEESPVTVVISDSKNAVEKHKKRKKISSKLFSRAPIREDIEIVDKTPVKKEKKKIEVKE